MNLFRKIADQGYYWVVQKPVGKFMKLMYLLIPLEFCKKVNVQNKKLKEPIIDMIVVSFNNDKIIEIQIDKLKEHVKDPFCLTIADNSTDKEYAGKIEKICIRKKVGYIKLPGQNYFKKSYSHGIALN